MPSNRLRTPGSPILSRKKQKQNGPKSYRYTPLEDPDTHIRIITILPGELRDDVHITISSQVLSPDLTPPQYEALSYAWGASGDPRKVYIGKSMEVTFSVGKNLASALEHLRYPDIERPMWIDAISIDQHNTEERGGQVQKMADIYTLAARVVVWLGPEENNSPLAMGMLQTIGLNVDVNWHLRTIHPSKKALSESSFNWPEWPSPLLSAQGHMQSLRYLINRTWFDRLWIRQEICLANPDAVVACGYDTVLWTAFRKAIYYIYGKQARESFFEPYETAFKERLAAINTLADCETLPIHIYTHFTRNCECSDPRDRIYAILGMYAELGLGIIPDYRLPKQAVYQDFILRVMAAAEPSVLFFDLDYLRFCQMTSEVSNWPSWVPDWSIREVFLPIYQAIVCGFSRAEYKYLGYGVLRAFGLKVATIAQADRYPESYNSRSEIVAQLERFSLKGWKAATDATLDEYTLLMWHDLVQEADPPWKSRPDTLKTSTGILKLLSSLKSEIDIPNQAASLDINLLIDSVRKKTANRTFFTTAEHHIGIGPTLAKAGDIVVIFPGCQSAMILRETREKKYKVIGDCFVEDFNHARALLGPLPDNYQPVLQRNKDDKENWGYRNLNTGETTSIDPRIGRLRSEVGNDGVKRVYVETPRLAGEDGGERRSVRMWTSCHRDEEFLLVGLDLEAFDLV
ncbi:hypothetical protein N431DRAFT_564789 [Stipitochalara longipes BDJ]|nr:hypothetical protein N431DRAFT_564789 [Stipitochalara longipes BDJ]